MRKEQLELMVENNWGHDNLLFQLNKHLYHKIYGHQ